MTELFTNEGHLTEEALQMLIEGQLDEVQRLEVGEHLSFCDCCLERYTALLTKEVLEAPAIDAAGPVMRKVHRRRRSETVRRIGSAAAAVAITCMLWYGGVFDAMGRTVAENVGRQETTWYESFSTSFLNAAGALSQRIMDAAASGLQISD